MYRDSNAAWYAAFHPQRSGTMAAPITILSHVPRGATLERYGPGLPALCIWQRSHVVIDGFSVVGQLKLRGEQDQDADYGRGCVLRNCDVVEGDQEGTDSSLNWGNCVHSSRNFKVQNNEVRGMGDRGNTSTNTAAIMYFGISYDGLFENNEADGTNVHSAYGQKGGELYATVWRYNVARNARSGDGGSAGCGFLGQGNTGGTTYCDDHQYYGNVAVNCRHAFFLNHTARRWKVRRHSPRYGEATWPNRCAGASSASSLWAERSSSVAQPSTAAARSSEQRRRAPIRRGSSSGGGPSAR